MIVGIPKEIKNNENRVAITPAGVDALVKNGHRVLVETNAGAGSGIGDDDYRGAGADVLQSREDVYSESEMIMKVKEPLREEYDLFHEGQVLFTYLHLAPIPELTKSLMDKRVIAIAYETIQAADGSLPLLIPMSEVAGRMSVQVGAQFLEKVNGGRGMLLGGVPGVPPAEVVILGGGTVGINAAKIAIGMGAHVTILDVSPNRLRYLDEVLHGNFITVMSNRYNIETAAKSADLLIGGVLIPGAKAPRLVTEDMVEQMKEGAVIVDVAIDQGGCIETIDHSTTHDNPVYVKHGVVHYAVANMPGAVPRTSTYALTNVTLPYALAIADKGYRDAVLDDSVLAKGVNVIDGCVTYEAVARDNGLEFHQLNEVLESKS